MKKQHPIALLQYTTRNFWLLLIPLLRGLFSLDVDFYSWLSGAYLDVLVIFVILGAAFFRWWNIRYEMTEKGVSFSFGFFIKEDFFIPYKSMSAVSSKRALILRPIRAVKIAIETDCCSAVGKISDPDVKIVVKLKDYKELFNKIPIKESGAKLTYKVPKTILLLFSFVFSSSLSGILYFGTLLIQGGRLVDRELEERFIIAVNDVTEIAQKIINGITPATVVSMIIVAAGWLYSFISNYLRHINFTIQRCGKSILIRNGFFSKWKYHINTERINYADIRQNLLMKICKVMSVHVSCSGYGKSRNEIPVFVPITTKKSVMGVMRMLMPEFPLIETSVNPRWNYIMRFIGPPTVMIFGVMLAAFALVIYLPGWYSVILFVAVMGEISAVHLLVVKLTAFYTNGLGSEGDIICMRYCRFYQFHYITLPKSKITSVELRQTIFQKMNQSCDFVIYTMGENVQIHRVRGINIQDAEKFVAEIGYDLI